MAFAKFILGADASVAKWLSIRVNGSIENALTKGTVKGWFLYSLRECNEAISKSFCI